jgi:hypothetical protein
MREIVGTTKNVRELLSGRTKLRDLVEQAFLPVPSGKDTRPTKI